MAEMREFLKPEEKHLARILIKWRDAGGPVEDVVFAIKGVVIEMLEQIIKNNGRAKGL